MVSSLTSEGIDKLKDKINEYSIDIVDKRINEIDNNSFKLVPKQKKQNKKEMPPLKFANKKNSLFLLLIKLFKYSMRIRDFFFDFGYVDLI